MLNATNSSHPTSRNAVPVLYGPDRDNAPNKFRYPRDAMQSDFFSAFRDDKDNQQLQSQLLSSTTKDTYHKHPAELSREYKAKASETARFNKEIHLALDRADGRSPAERYTTVVQRDYVPHELPDTTDHVCHENKYPPVFRDETHLITPNKSLYGLSFTDSPSHVREPAMSRLSARLRRSRLRADSIVLGADPDHDLAGGGHAMAAADLDRTMSVTKRDFSDQVAKNMGPRHDLLMAKQLRDRDKKPSTVLECPDGEVADVQSTVQSDYRPPNLDKMEAPDMSFKTELVATHVSLATTAANGKDEHQAMRSQYQSNYVPHKVRVVDNKAFGKAPKAVLFCEDEGEGQGCGKTRSGTPGPTSTSTAKASFVAHKVHRHMPIHHRDVSSVFAGLDPDKDGSAHRKIKSVSQSDYTEHDWLSSRFGSATPGRRVVPSTRSHVLVPEDDTPASRVSESHAQFQPQRASVAAEFAEGRLVSRAQLKSASASHFALGNEVDDAGRLKLATETTTNAHHATSAHMADALLAQSRLQSLGDVGLKRKPVKPDHSFETSLHNTVAWDDGTTSAHSGNKSEDGRERRRFDATSTSRATYVEPPADVLLGGAHQRFQAGSHVDHITPLATDINTKDGKAPGEWVSTTKRVHVPPTRALAMAMAEAVVNDRPF